MTLRDKVESYYVRDGMGVDCIEQRMREDRSRFYGHVQGKNSDDLVSRVRDLKVGGKRVRGRPFTRWDSVIGKDMTFCGLKKEMVHDREEWRCAIRMPTLYQLGQRQER